MKINLHPETLLGKLFYKFYKNKKFKTSASYWEKRYSEGKNSGAGSYSKLAEFKAGIINEFVRSKNIETVIEFGCGDGNQLKLAQYPKYIGLDVSKTAIRNCINMFANDTTKSFFLYNSLTFVDKQQIFRADLTLSLDVIYHLVENAVFEAYMRHLFDASEKYVIIYSSNNEGQHLFHVKERNFTTWVGEKYKNWELTEVIKNKYPYDPKDSANTSFADFYIYNKNRT